MLTDLEKTIICDRDEAIRDVTDKAKNDPTGFIRDWGSFRDLCDYECHLLDREEAVYRAMRNAVDAIDGRAEAMLSEIRTASVRSIPRKISCFVHHDDKMAICRVYVNGEEFKGESVGFGRKNDTAALTNALNKSNAVLNILFNSLLIILILKISPLGTTWHKNSDNSPFQQINSRLALPFPALTLFFLPPTAE